MSEATWPDVPAIGAGRRVTPEQKLVDLTPDIDLTRLDYATRGEPVPGRTVIGMLRQDSGVWCAVYSDQTFEAIGPELVTAAGRAVEGTASSSARLEELRSRMLSSAALDAIPAPVPLIDGHLYEDTIAELWGKPGCGKSFLAIDWAESIATGKHWQQQTTQQRPVLYIVGEGAGGVGKRKRAWHQAWKPTRGEQMTWLRGAVPLMEAGWVDVLAQAVDETRPALIVVDTLSRAIAGHNENAPEVMSKVVDHADQIRQAAGGACILFVHHATKDGGTNRGHSALEGACDVRWKLAKDGQVLTLSNPKAKDDEEAPDRQLRLRPWELYGEADDLGMPVTSCVIESHREAPTTDELTASENHLLAVMRDSFGTTGATGAQLRDVADLPKSTFYRALNTLAEREALTNSGTDKRPHWHIAPTLAETPHEQ